MPDIDQLHRDTGAQELADFKNIDNYKQWLFNLGSRDLWNDRQILPARATLRIVPLMADSINTGPLDLHAKVFSTIFRAGALALILPIDKDANGYGQRATSGAGADATNMQLLSMTATFICRAVGYAAEYIDSRAIIYAEYAINSEAGTENEARLPAHDLMWREISADATTLEERETRLAAASRPLWSSQMPERMARQWTSVKNHLWKLDEAAWMPVTNWYEARLRGDLIDIGIDRIEKIIPVP